LDDPGTRVCWSFKQWQSLNIFWDSNHHVLISLRFQLEGTKAGHFLE